MEGGIHILTARPTHCRLAILAAALVFAVCAWDGAQQCKVCMMGDETGQVQMSAWHSPEKRCVRRRGRAAALPRLPSLLSGAERCTTAPQPAYGGPTIALVLRCVLAQEELEGGQHDPAAEARAESGIQMAWAAAGRGAASTAWLHACEPRFPGRASQQHPIPPAAPPAPSPHLLLCNAAAAMTFTVRASRHTCAM